VIAFRLECVIGFVGIRREIPWGASTMAFQPVSNQLC
jgi:hypothetical protein